MPVGNLFTRRRRAAVATAAMSALAVTGLVHEPAAVAAAPSRTPGVERPVAKPNLLLVTVDDLSYLDMDYLPQVRKLVERTGVSFAEGIRIRTRPPGLSFSSQTLPSQEAPRCPAR